MIGCLRIFANVRGGKLVLRELRVRVLLLVAQRPVETVPVYSNKPVLPVNSFVGLRYGALYLGNGAILLSIGLSSEEGR